MRLIIEKIPTQVPPVMCVYADTEEAEYRLETDDNHRYLVCKQHMREYLQDVVMKLE